jgi:hypothetical protein
LVKFSLSAGIPRKFPRESEPSLTRDEERRKSRATSTSHFNTQHDNKAPSNIEHRTRPRTRTKIRTVDVRTAGFVVSFRSCRAILGGFLLLAMLCSYLVSDTGSLPSLSRSTGCGHFPVSPDQQVVVTSQSLQINKNQYPIFNVAFPYFTIQIRKVNYA